MLTRHSHRTLLPLLVTLLLLAAATTFLLNGCTDSSSAFEPNYTAPTPVFTDPTAITNSHLPLAALTQDILEGTEGSQVSRVERTRLAGTKMFTVNGAAVAAMIVEDRAYLDGELVEVALDYFAQADDGTVYYLGEDVDIYAGGVVVSHEGAWLYGVNTNALGILMPGVPEVGQKFRSENVPHVTREDDEVVSVSETVTVPAGTYTDCVKIKEMMSDGEIEYKYYAPGVGVVREVPEDGDVQLQSHT